MNQIIVLANAIKAKHSPLLLEKEIEEERAYLRGEHWRELRLDVRKRNLQRRGVKR